MGNPHIGESFDEFLKDEGILDEVHAAAIDALADEAVEEHECGDTINLREVFDEILPHIKASLEYLKDK